VRVAAVAGAGRQQESDIALRNSYTAAFGLARRIALVRSAAAMGAGLPRHDREDAEQEALMRVWQALPFFDKSRGSLRTFIEVVIATRIASLLRSSRRRPEVEVLDERYHVDDQAFTDAELRSDIQLALSGLSKQDRRLARLLMHHSPSESSRALKKARSTVYEGMRRIRVALIDAGIGPHVAPDYADMKCHRQRTEG